MLLIKRVERDCRVNVQLFSVAKQTVFSVRFRLFKLCLFNRDVVIIATFAKNTCSLVGHCLIEMRFMYNAVRVPNMYSTFDISKLHH